MWGLLFRLPWWAYFDLSPLALGGAGYAYFDERHDEAERAAALHQKPPANVAIEAFDPRKNVGRASEVVVTGQVDLTRSMELTETKRGVERHHWTLAPIYPAAAADATTSAVGVLVHDGALSDDQLGRFVTGRGTFGPVMTLNGRARSDGEATEALQNGIAEKVKIAPNAVLVDPFVDGREAGLAPDPNGMVFTYILLALAVVMAGVGGYRYSIRPEPGTI